MVIYIFLPFALNPKSNCIVLYLLPVLNPKSYDGTLRVMAGDLGRKYMYRTGLEGLVVAKIIFFTW